MSKEESRLAFKWQKSYSDYVFLVTILLGLFAVRNEFSENLKFFVYFLLAIIILLVGINFISSKIDEYSYVQHIRDKRFKVSKIRKIVDWAIIIAYIIGGCLIVYVGIKLWVALFFP